MAWRRAPIDGHPLHGDLKQILGAAQRSAELTRQLLAFTRQQPACPRVLDLNDQVAGMERLRRRVIGDDLALQEVPPGGARQTLSGLANVDLGHDDQILRQSLTESTIVSSHGQSLCAAPETLTVDRPVRI